MTGNAEFISPSEHKVVSSLEQIQLHHNGDTSAQLALAKLNDLVSYIQTKINSSNHKRLGSEIQIELSELLLLPPRLGKCILDCAAKRSSFWRKLLGLLPGVSCKDQVAEISLMFPSLIMAVESLFQETPNLVLAKKIRRDISKNLRRYEINSPILLFVINIIKDTLNSQSIPLKVSVGLLLSLPFYATFMLIAGAVLLNTSSLIAREQNTSAPGALNTGTVVGGSSPAIDETPTTKPPTASPSPAAEEAKGSTSDSIAVPSTTNNSVEKKSEEVVSLQENLLQLILVVSAGTLGSIVSILTRIREFRNENYKDSSLPIFVGLFKPVIGASFGVLIFTLISSDLITISTLEGSARKEQRAFFFYSVAFVIGFSERLANDIVSRTENMFSNSQSASSPESVILQQLSRKDLPVDVVQDLTSLLVQLSAKPETKDTQADPLALPPALPAAESVSTIDTTATSNASSAT